MQLILRDISRSLFPSYTSRVPSRTRFNSSPLPTAKTASTLAHYRASPIPHPSSREQVRDLPSFTTAHSADDGRHSMPSLVDPISRPSSTSTVNSSLHHSASLPQLPGLSALASLASSSNSPQMRYVCIFQFRGSVLGFGSGRKLVGFRRLCLHFGHGPKLFVESIRHWYFQWICSGYHRCWEARPSLTRYCKTSSLEVRG